jgi:hypothetical protein
MARKNNLGEFLSIDLNKTEMMVGGEERIIA